MVALRNTSYGPQPVVIFTTVVYRDSGPVLIRNMTKHFAWCLNRFDLLKHTLIITTSNKYEIVIFNAALCDSSLKYMNRCTHY